MTSYTDKNKITVKELIDKYVQDVDYDIHIAIKDAVMNKMNETASVIDVADAVFDYTYMTQKVCSKAILLVLRNEIIIALS